MEQQASQVYALGHSESELQRLEQQGLFLRDMTKHIHQACGYSALSIAAGGAGGRRDRLPRL